LRAKAPGKEKKKGDGGRGIPRSALASGGKSEPGKPSSWVTPHQGNGKKGSIVPSFGDFRTTFNDRRAGRERAPEWQKFSMRVAGSAQPLMAKKGGLNLFAKAAGIHKDRYIRTEQARPKAQRG